jgi:O-antigen ligase
MFSTLRSSIHHFDNQSQARRVATVLVSASVLVLAFLLGQRASPLWLGLFAAGAGAFIVLTRPALIPLALVAAALLIPVGIGTGTEVKLNAVALLVPILAGVWLLNMIRRRGVRVARSRANLPLLLFLAAGLLSLLIGRATWDPLVPVDSDFLLVQLAQWAIFVFSALAFWLAANLVTGKAALWRLTAFFLLVAGAVAILSLIPGVLDQVRRFTTLAFIRAPLWVLLTALAGGQLLYNRRLSPPWRLFLIAALLAALVYAFIEEQDAASNWVGLTAAIGTLVWLRFPRLRWLLVVLVVLLTVAGVLIPAVYNFAGGNAEWQGSGASRLTLIKRVIDVTMRSPITGLGPAAYRRYAAMEPLKYGTAYWGVPNVNSHNNYVDLFSHVGIVGLALFLWFMGEVAWLAQRLRQRYKRGFAAGYVNGMLATWVAIMVLMLLLDWFLPFVYNVGFLGFQASVLVWLFLGGIVALEQAADRETAASGAT